MEIRRHEKTDTHIATETSVITIIINIVLSVLKLAAGILAHSGALISDAIHSASDVFSTFIVLIGVRISGKESDQNHPYGHERFECVASIILALLLAVTGVGIGINGIKTIISGDLTNLAIPGLLALIAALVSIIVKEAMYWYTRAAAKKINSGALMADAWHHRSDALSSIGSLIGVAGARLGFPVLDPIASVIICLFILKVAVDIFIDAIKKMTDESCDQETIKKMTNTILDQSGVQALDEIKTRVFGTKIYVDIEISVDRTISLDAAHDIAEKVHQMIESGYPGVKHCMVHVNPADKITEKTI